MIKKAIEFFAIGIISVFSTTLAYADDLSVGNITMDIPETWDELENTLSEDGSLDVKYNCGNGQVAVLNNPYSEELSEFSYVFMDGALEGLRGLNGYQELESSDTTFDGHAAHITSFLLDEGAGIAFLLDTGESIMATYYIGPISAKDEMDEFVELIGSVNFNSSSFNEPPSGNDSNVDITKYQSGMYKVGVDMPAGEYIVFVNDGTGYFCVSSDSNQDDILFNDNFDYNSIITINDGEYLDLSRCYAVPFEEDPEVKTTGEGMFKVGTHIPAGEYKLDAGTETGYYCIYSNSRHDDIISNDNFDGQNYVTVSDGQYLVLNRCKFVDPPEKPAKTYTDSDTVKKVQEALNASGYDCGAPDGIAGSGTKSQIEKYQSDNGLSVTGTITDELLNALGI